MKKINPNLFPKTGYFFQDNDGSIHRASGWNGVIARVRAYRARAKMAPGNPEREVTEQVCARNPLHCTEESPAHTAQVRIVSLKGRLLAWLSAMIKQNRADPLPFRIGEEEKQRRADICAGCPLNTKIQESCGSCRAAMTELQREIIGARKMDSRIVGCLALGESLPVSVWLDLQTVENQELPGHCWRKRG